MSGSNLRLLTLNVNGLQNASKRRTLFSCILQGRWDVVLLQETHHASEAEALAWLREGAGPARAVTWESFWSQGTSRSKGVGILVRPGGAFSPVSTSVARDAAGRVVRVDGTFGSQALSIINVYAPCEAGQRTHFFLHTLRPLIPAAMPVCVGGDFNCIACPQRDQQGSSSTGRLVGYTGGLEAIEQEFALVDAWRQLHPRGVDFTHLITSGASSARLDRWLVSAPLLSQTHACAVSATTGMPGDHHPVTLALKPVVTLPRGPGVWCFPTQLLDDPGFCTHIEHILDTCPIVDLPAAEAPAAARWDAMKRRVRDAALLYSFRAAQQRRQRFGQLAQRARRAKQRLVHHPADPAALAEWADANAALQEHQVLDARRSALTAGVIWQDFGEQSTYWFHKLGRQRRERTCIAALQGDASEPASEFSLQDATGIAKAKQVITDYYSGDSPSGLFRAYPTDPAAQQRLLDSVDRVLTQEQADACEGPSGDGTLTAEEMQAALGGTPNNKHPGADGLPYEFYKRFWDKVCPSLLAVCDEALASGALPASMTCGVVTLLYKGEGSRAVLKHYRPITLLNCDYKVIAKVLANRMAGPLAEVLDATQTGFLPGRWIGDNVLSHLEEVDYLRATSEPGCIIFLDFEKAFDRTNRHWIQLCLDRLGFGTGVQRWVSIIHANTAVQVLYNGWRTDHFPLHSGVYQGSPLSPLLFNVAAQPLASFLRQLHAGGRLRGIALPDGSCAPVCQQHADDTTLHLRAPRDVKVALDDGVEVYCAATGAKLNRGKSKGLAFNQPGPVMGGRDPTTQVEFVHHSQVVRHLGILICPDDPAMASARMFATIKSSIAAHVCHWSAHHLSPLGRIHVAKQVLASMVYYHATFVPPDDRTLADITQMMDRFVTDSGVYRPDKCSTCLPIPDGGLKMVNMGSMISALHAKVWARLLSPPPLLWKSLLRWRLTQGPSAGWGLGAFAPLSHYPLHHVSASPRIRAYMRAFRALHCHRTAPISSLSVEHVLVERLFYNDAICTRDGRMLTGPGWKPLADAGITSVLRLLHALIDPATPPPLRTLCFAVALPSQCATLHTMEALNGALRWRMVAPDVVLDTAATPPLQYQVQPGGVLLPDLQPLAVVASLEHAPACVVMEPPQREDRPPEAAGPPAAALAARLVGPIDTTHVHPSAWQYGCTPVHAYVVHSANTRLLHIAAMAALPGFTVGAGAVPRAAACCLLAREASLHARFAEFVQAHGRGKRRHPVAAEELRSVYHASWMDAPGPRAHYRDRRLLCREGPGVGQPRQAPGNGRRTTGGDVLRLPPVAAGAAHQGVWSVLAAVPVDRVVRFTVWRAMHAALPCGAHRLHAAAADAAVDPASVACPCCPGVLQTLSHLLVVCPVARSVWHWVWGLWSRVGGPTPPAPSVDLCVVADPAVWQPPAALATLWHALRCLTLQALWSTASAPRGADGPPVAPAAARVVAVLVASVRTHALRDWTRVVSDPRLCMPGTYSSWFRGRDARMSREDFAARWCAGGVICGVGPLERGPPGAPSLGLDMRLSVASSALLGGVVAGGGAPGVGDPAGGLG